MIPKITDHPDPPQSGRISTDGNGVDLQCSDKKTGYDQNGEILA